MIRNIILAIILLIQCAIWFIGSNPFSTEKPRSETVSEHKLDDIPIAEVERIEVTSSSAPTLRLVKKDGIWCIENVFGYPAIQEKVAQALAAIQHLSRAEFRNAKAFLHEDLEVDERRGTKLRLFARGGRLIEDLVIGKRDVENSGGTFIRRRSEDAVFVTRARNLETAFSVVPRNWYDLGVWDFPVTDQQRITDLKLAAFKVIVEGKERLTRNNRDNRASFRHVMEFVPRNVKTKEAEYWRVVEPEDKKDLILSDLQVRSMITSMLNMRTQEIIGQGTKPEYRLDDVDDLEVRLTVFFREGEKGENETIRTVNIGAARPMPALGARGPQTYYMKATHPGSQLKQAFVHGVANSYLAYFQRGADAYVDTKRMEKKKAGGK